MIVERAARRQVRELVLQAPRRVRPADLEGLACVGVDRNGVRGAAIGRRHLRRVTDIAGIRVDQAQVADRHAVEGAGGSRRTADRAQHHVRTGIEQRPQLGRHREGLLHGAAAGGRAVGAALTARTEFRKRVADGDARLRRLRERRQVLRVRIGVIGNRHRERAARGSRLAPRLRFGRREVDGGIRRHAIVDLEVRVSEQRVALARARQPAVVVHAVELRHARALEPGDRVGRVGEVVTGDLVRVGLRATQQAGEALRTILDGCRLARGSERRVAREQRAVRVEEVAALRSSRA